MGGFFSTYAVGNTVIINSYHPRLIKEFQSTCGGWDLEMVECLSNPSTITAMQGDIFTIKAISGRSYKINQNLLKSYGSSSDAVTLTALTHLLFHSIQQSNLVDVKHCIDIIGTKESIQSCPPLVYAAQEGKLEIVKLLIQEGAYINETDAKGTTALHMAVHTKKADICRVLLGYGADVNKQNKDSLTPLMLAVISKNQEIVKLVAGASNINFNLGDKDKDTALHLAVQLSEIGSIETLLLCGANVDTVNRMNLTAFHWAAVAGNERVLETFLKSKPLLANLQDENKFTALHIAALKNHVECVKILVKYNADKDIQNIVQQTPLHAAISQTNWECVKILIDNGADLNKKDIRGDTPLHIAMILYIKDGNILLSIMNVFVQSARASELETIITNMVQRGARLDIANIFGLTPEDMCLNIAFKTKLLAIQGNQSRQLVQRVNEDRNVDELKRVIRQMVEEDDCINCHIRKKSTVFTCSHMACDECARDMINCFICGKPIIQKIKLRFNYETQK